MDDALHTDKQYHDALKTKETEVLFSASQLLDSPLPTTPAEQGVYAFHNLRLQNLVNELRTRVEWAKHGRTSTLRQTEVTLLRDAREDGVRDKAEREASCYKNAKWRDINDTVVQLTLLAERLKSVEWMLKSGLSFVESRRS